MTEKPSRCPKCEELFQEYGDVSLERIRAWGNLSLADLRSASETMDMLVQALALADQKLARVKDRIEEHEAAWH